MTLPMGAMQQANKMAWWPCCVTWNVHEGTRSLRYGVLGSHTHVRDSKLKRLILDSFYITSGDSLRYIFKKLNLLGTFCNQWRKTGMTSGRG